VPISPDFSALEAVITAKVESVATNIDNKDLLIQMKALEAAVANLALTRVIAEGTYQQGQVTATANTAVTTLNTGVATATTNLNATVTTATTNLNAASAAAIDSFNTTSGAVLATINDLLADLGDTNTQDIIDLVTLSLGQITTAANNANAALTQLKQDALSVISSTGTTVINNVNDARDSSLTAVSGAQTTAISGINVARDAAIQAVSASGDAAALINFVRDDRWLGLNIFAPTNMTGN
jgi:hypothetical protein